MEKEEMDKCIDEIQEYHGKSLTELVMDLTKEPIVRAFTGDYFQIIGVGNNIDDSSNIEVVLRAISNNVNKLVFTQELISFLSPVPEDINNPTKQDRKYKIIDDFEIQLDLLPTEILLEELSKRESDLISITKKSILDEDYVIAMVTETEGQLQYMNILNTFSSKEDAEANLKRNKKNKTYKSDDIQILKRMFIKEQ